MSRPKLEANTNRDRAPDPKQKGKHVDYKKPTRHGSQAGTFVGDPSAVHVHIVGNNTHIIVRGERTEIKLHSGGPLKVKTLKDARTALGKANASVPGYGSCLAWLKEQG